MRNCGETKGVDQGSQLSEVLHRRRETIVFELGAREPISGVQSPTNVMELIQEADRSKWMAHSNHSIKCFTKGDIDRMTNNYRTSLGSGAFGKVYEGVLDDGNMVAVKRFIHNVKENFAKELIVHREINHKNVVRLIGCCEEENALMLVTEYIANGNLSDFLHNNNGPVPFDVRLRIAIECAEALAYMHSDMYTQVIHGDIKPGNILLDSNFHAKLSDFGISRLVNTTVESLHTMNVIGSRGYMDPLFVQDGCLTVNNDVYSFGVVLLELITRKKATAVLDNVNTVSAFTNALASGVRGVRGMFDAEIASKNNMKIIERVAKLAGECLTMERGKRPEMVDVRERLRLLRATRQGQGQQRVDLFSWVRKSKPAPSAASTVPAMIFLKDPAPSPDPAMIFLKDPAPSPDPAMILPSHVLCRQFSFTEMKAATNDFDKSHIDGRDGQDRVIYFGKIDGGATKVAIIKHSYDSDFHLYIEGMSKLHHGNLVPLIGYCHIKKILVYEYMARGNLRQYLYSYTQRSPPFSWKLRVEACIGAARGLRYLHKSQIIHGDVKTENILLDEEWLAKITVVPLPCTMFHDCVCWLDPECISTGQCTEKSDVYSFGMVLLDVLLDRSARPNPYVYPPSPGDEPHSLVARVLRRKEEGKLDQMVDPYLKGKINPQCLDKFINTAKNCLAYSRIDRPSMRDVILDLEYALQLQEGIRTCL